MPKPTSDADRQKPFFVNQFVNTVYGIVLGYGFSNALSQIEVQLEKPGSAEVGAPYAIAAVLYVIIVICVYWWDWVDNIGHRALNTAREFALDISILVSLESLFFVFEYPVFFSSLFFLLAVLNLLWVYNLRYDEYQSLKSAKKIQSWSEYLGKHKRAKRHIRNRWYGILLFGGCVVFVVLSNGYHLDQHMLKWLLQSEAFTENWKGYWTVLLVILSAGLFNRLVLYRDRFEPKCRQSSEEA